MNLFLGGAIMIAYAVAGLFFFKFWKKSRDRFYAIFASAFWVLAINRIMLAEVSTSAEGTPIYYVVRVFAFLLIVLAIVDKNYSR